MKAKTDTAQVSFYHFTLQPFALGLSRLIKKIYSTGQNLLVVCKTEAEIHELDRTLWTFASKEFIPHGTTNEADAELQPVLLTTDPNGNKNASKILLSTCTEPIDPLLLPSSNFPANTKNHQIYAFYGIAEEIKHMTDLYQSYNSRDDISATFWKQDQNGKWSKPSA